MTKKRYQKISLKDIKTEGNNNPSQYNEFDPNEIFRDQTKVATALFQALLENDTETYLEIIEGFLRAKISRHRRKC